MGRLHGNALVLVFLLMLHAVTSGTPTSAEGADWCIDPDKGREGDACTNDYDCLPLQACAGGRCSVNSVGDACETDEDCGFSNVGCSDGFCKVRRSLGDTCTSGEECSSGICDAGSGLCGGRALGAACDPMAVPNQCDHGSFCSHTGVCTASLRAGDSCAEHAAAAVGGTMAVGAFLDVCVGSDVCDGPQGEETCALVMSTRLGEACGPGQFACDLNGGMTCQRTHGGTHYGTCQREGVIDTPCRGSLGCTRSSWCMCDDASVSRNGTCTPVYSDDCNTEQTNLLLCGVTLRCHRSISLYAVSDPVRGEYNMPIFQYDGACFNDCLSRQQQFMCCMVRGEFAAQDMYLLPFSCDGGDDDDGESSSGMRRHGPLPVLGALVLAGAWLLHML